MTIEQLKKEVESLSFQEKGQLAAYILRLRDRQEPGYLAEMQRRIDDKDRWHWLTPEEFESRPNAEK